MFRFESTELEATPSLTPLVLQGFDSPRAKTS